MINSFKFRAGITGLTLILAAGCTNIGQQSAPGFDGTLQSACIQAAPAAPATGNALDGTAHSACPQAAAGATAPARRPADNAGARRIYAGAGRT